MSLLFVCLYLFGGQSTYAQYRLDHWTADDGLPQNAVRGIVQTRDGYLWLTTFDGLVRFDGVRFTVFNKNSSPGIITNRFVLLYEDASGDLWATSAGQGVPFKFSLSGNKGLNILAVGYPVSSPVACDASEPGDLVEETVNAGGSSLSYSATADQYSYIWKTDKAWKGTCRIMVIKLKDGTEHLAKFKFK